MSDDIAVTEDEAAAAAKSPHRVTLESMKNKIESVQYLNPTVAPHLTLAIVLIDNGFTIIGKSAPADPANFNAELGQKFAYEDALRQMWGFEGYLMCEKLTSREGKS